MKQFYYISLIIGLFCMTSFHAQAQEKTEVDTLSKQNGVFQEVQNELKIYPNPARNVIYVPKHFIDASYHIFNIIGEQLLSGVLIHNQIAIDALPNGTYFIRVINKDGHHTSRFVKSI